MIKPTIDQVAHDPDVQRALARYARRGTELPVEPPYKVRLKDVKPTIEDLVLRVLRLEAELQRIKGGGP